MDTIKLIYAIILAISMYGSFVIGDKDYIKVFSVCMYILVAYVLYAFFFGGEKKKK